MSVTLLVRLKRPVTLAELEAASTAAMRDILAFKGNTAIEARFDQSDAFGERSAEVLTRTSGRVLCSLIGHEKTVTVTPFTVPVQVQTGQDSSSFVDQDYVSVAWHSKKSALCWALVAAVALALAALQGADVEDNSGFFTTDNLQQPSTFGSKVSLAGQNSDLELAAAMFYAALPKSSEVTDWLKTEARSDEDRAK